jgi:hypothetical protein
VIRLSDVCFFYFVVTFGFSFTNLSPAVYKLPKFPDMVQTKLSSKDASAFGPGTKFKGLLVDALYSDLRKHGILYVRATIFLYK